MEGGSKSDNGGEVRKVNLVYFLSHLGHVEHPHLLRVLHHTRNGVFLRDVKRWLADARGNAMPDAFSWSYKRRYKNGFVWQDLSDGDLITPISDNEYVLKGSEVLQSFPKDHSSIVGKRSWGTRSDDRAEDSLRQSTSGIHKESPVFGSHRSSTTTITTLDYSVTTEEETSTRLKTEDLSKSDELGDRKSITTEVSTGKRQGNDSGRPNVPSKSSSSSSGTYTRSKSYSSGTSHVIRSLMTCGGLDINDTVLMPLNRFTKTAASWEDQHRHQYQHPHNARKSFDRAWNGLKMKEKLELSRSKPAIGPICSQCGKSFNPEKMHSHMKVCRGMKNSNKNAQTSQRHGISLENVLMATRPSVLSSRSLKA